VSSFIGLAILASAAWLLVGPLVVVLGDFLVDPNAGEGQGSELLSPAVIIFGVFCWSRVWLLLQIGGYSDSVSKEKFE
jgi:hypothetical protein